MCNKILNTKITSISIYVDVYVCVLYVAEITADGFRHINSFFIDKSICGIINVKLSTKFLD